MSSLISGCRVGGYLVIPATLRPSVVGEDPALVGDIAKDCGESLTDEGSRDIVGEPSFHAERISGEPEAELLKPHGEKIEGDERQQSVARHLGLTFVESPPLVTNISKDRSQQDGDELGHQGEGEHRSLVPRPWGRIDEKIKGQVVNDESDTTDNKEL